LNQERFLATFESLLPDGIEEVYDLTEPEVHLFVANGIICHNCGEQGLPPFGVCNLGAINLSSFVHNGKIDRKSTRLNSSHQIINSLPTRRSSDLLNQERFLATFESLLPDGIEEVYDLTEPEVHLFVANGIICHNCGEQGLPPFGVCNLGAINLSSFVHNGK